MIFIRLNINDIVTRKSYNNDILFQIISIDGDNVILKGVDLRLYADSLVDDLVKVEKTITSSDSKIIERNVKELNIDRSKFFYLPGKILHIDGDSDYLDRCMNFYKNMGVKANGFYMNEDSIKDKIIDLLIDYKPDIVVITGHDAFYKKRNDFDNMNNYQNSSNFIDAVKKAREYEKSHEKLIIIAGACQSNYEAIIKSGANFASSPKRMNLHALDPAIIASSIALSDRNKSLDIISLISKTKYGKDGIGGIITNGTMYVGYPR